MKKTVFSDLGLSSNQLAQVVGFNIIRVMNAKKISLKELSQMTGIHYHQLSSYAREGYIFQQQVFCMYWQRRCRSLWRVSSR